MSTSTLIPEAPTYADAEAVIAVVTVPEVPAQPTIRTRWPADQPKKLSQLIREGAAQTKPAVREYVHWHQELPGEAGAWHACAVGAAAWAIDAQACRNYEHPLSIIEDHTGIRLGRCLAPWPKDDHAPYPVMPSDPANLWQLIMSLNDDYRWSREQIADYLESVGY